MGVDHQFVRDQDILFVYSGERMEPGTIKMIRDELLVKVGERQTHTRLLGQQAVSWLWWWWCTLFLSDVCAVENSGRSVSTALPPMVSCFCFGGVFVFVSLFVSG